jgi:polyisoprenoid-binding protein YceI
MAPGIIAQMLSLHVTCTHLISCLIRQTRDIVSYRLTQQGRQRNLKTTASFTVWLITLLFAFSAISPAQNHEIVLEFNPAMTTVDFTLGDVIHTVHGGFDLKHGGVHFNSDTGAVSGDIVIDSPSGHSGNNTRDRKMHREILESDRFPEITFRPDHVDGKVAPQGTSTVQVHGLFSIHGTEHEMTVPVQVVMAPDHWAITTHFVVPYVKWGMKNPSTFILRVSESVEIDLRASGTSLSPAGSH